MSYTYNWNSEFISNTKDIKNLSMCLEIGCFEGLTSNYICDNMLSNIGTLFCVDPLMDEYICDAPSDVEQKDNGTLYSYFDGQYDRFIKNTEHQILSGKLKLVRELSKDALPALIPKYAGVFDFVYIDGDHREEPVYKDAEYSFLLCRNGGIILFDDYMWANSRGDRTTKLGIDRFLIEFKDDIEVLMISSQVMVRKK